jgi:hypothetical protein
MRSLGVDINVTLPRWQLEFLQRQRRLRGLASVNECIRQLVLEEKIRVTDAERASRNHEHENQRTS